MDEAVGWAGLLGSYWTGLARPLDCYWKGRAGPLGCYWTGLLGGRGFWTAIERGGRWVGGAARLLLNEAVRGGASGLPFD